MRPKGLINGSSLILSLLPQGFILDSVLFVIIIHDLSEDIEWQTENRNSVR